MGIYHPDFERERDSDRLCYWYGAFAAELAPARGVLPSRTVDLVEVGSVPGLEYKSRCIWGFVMGVR